MAWRLALRVADPAAHDVPPAPPPWTPAADGPLVVVTGVHAAGDGDGAGLRALLGRLDALVRADRLLVVPGVGVLVAARDLFDGEAATTAVDGGGDDPPSVRLDCVLANGLHCADRLLNLLGDDPARDGGPGLWDGRPTLRRCAVETAVVRHAVRRLCATTSRPRTPASVDGGGGGGLLDHPLLHGEVRDLALQRPRSQARLDRWERELNPTLPGGRKRRRHP